MSHIIDTRFKSCETALPTYGTAMRSILQTYTQDDHGNDHNDHANLDDHDDYHVYYDGIQEILPL